MLRRRPWEPMEFPSETVVRAGKRSGLGRCKHFFWLGVIFDTVGAAVLFIGVFADLLFYDMLLYLGAIIIFLSLLWWVSWYTGNIELLPEDTLPRGPLRPSGSAANNIRRSVSLRFSQTFATFAMALERVRRRRLRGRSPRPNPKTSDVRLTVPDLLEKRAQSRDALDVCREGAGPMPEDDGRSEAVGFPGRAAAGGTHLAWPVLPQYSGERRPPLPLQPCRSQPVAPAFPSDVFPAPRSDVSLTSAGQPPVTLPSTSQLVAQRHPSVPMTSQDYSLVSVATQREHLPQAPQTQRFSVQGSESQTWTPQVSLKPFLSTQSFQSVGIQSAPEIQDFLTAFHSQQLSSSSLFPVSASQSLDLQEMSKKIVTQVFESLPLPNQKPSQELPDTMSPVSEAAESRQSAPTDVSYPASKSQLFVLTDIAESQESDPTDIAESRQSVPTDIAESRQSVPTDIAECRQPVPTDISESRQSVPTDIAESRQSVPTDIAESRQSVPTDIAESRQSVPTDAAESRQSVPTEAAESRQSVPTEAAESRQSVPTEAAESRQSVPTEAAESRQSVPTEVAESRQSVPTEVAESRQSVPTDVAESRQSVPTDVAEPRQSVPTDSAVTLGAAKKGHL